MYFKVFKLNICCSLNLLYFNSMWTNGRYTGKSVALPFTLCRWIILIMFVFTQKCSLYPDDATCHFAFRLPFKSVHFVSVCAQELAFGCSLVFCWASVFSLQQRGSYSDCMLWLDQVCSHSPGTEFFFSLKSCETICSSSDCSRLDILSASQAWHSYKLVLPFVICQSNEVEDF